MRSQGSSPCSPCLILGKQSFSLCTSSDAAYKVPTTGTIKAMAGSKLSWRTAAPQGRALPYDCLAQASCSTMPRMQFHDVKT
eukprot:3957284-Pleurochrysis_carterae.AAC.2